MYIYHALILIQVKCNFTPINVVQNACKSLFKIFVEILCVQVWKWKMRPVETILRKNGGEIKNNDGGSEFD
jgi:hypothetical protein